MATLKLRVRFVALFGILGLLSMMALATWHDSFPHVDIVDSRYDTQVGYHDHGSDHHDRANSDHSHGVKDQPNGSDMIHVAAHAVVQGVDIPAQPVIAMMQVASVARWVMAPAGRIDSLKPDSLLRPPRA
jgi:hypothetical protein